MEPFSQVHNSENQVFGLIFQHISNEGEGMRVAQGSLIKLALVHHEAPLTFFFLWHNETVGRPLVGRARLSPTMSQEIFHYLLLRRGTSPHQSYWLHGLGFSIRVYVKLEN